jgi:hypothetical protein
MPVILFVPGLADWASVRAVFEQETRRLLAAIAASLSGKTIAF